MLVSEKEKVLINDLNEYVNEVYYTFKGICLGMDIPKKLIDSSNNVSDFSEIQAMLEDIKRIFCTFSIKSYEIDDESHLSLVWTEFKRDKELKTHRYDSDNEELTENKLIFNLCSFYYEAKQKCYLLNKLYGVECGLNLQKLESIILEYVNY